MIPQPHSEWSFLEDPVPGALYRFKTFLPQNSSMYCFDAFNANRFVTVPHGTVGMCIGLIGGPDGAIFMFGELFVRLGPIDVSLLELC